MDLIRKVYQATDLKLDRDVAIKILPEEFAKDTERVSRVRREGKQFANPHETAIAISPDGRQFVYRTDAGFRPGQSHPKNAKKSQATLEFR